MWNYMIPIFNENLYDVGFWFLIYSVMGWLVETVYISLCNKKFTNRGYVHGPICPIYGVGGLFVHLVLVEFTNSYLEVFLLGSILATSIEFITAKIMIRLFSCVWWDYTNKPFNYKGILCLESSVVWGLYAIMDVSFLKDLIFVIVDQIPYAVGKAILVTTTIYYVIDFIVCTKNNKNGEIEVKDNNIVEYKF